MTARHPATRVISAHGRVAARRHHVFSALADLDTHEALTDRRMRIVELHGRRGARTGGRVRLRGPLGLTREATTHVTGTSYPHTLEGTARTHSNARAAIRWHLTDGDTTTAVRVELEVLPGSWSDRALLAAGGTWWFRRRLSDAIGRLDGAVAQEHDA